MRRRVPVPGLGVWLTPRKASRALKGKLCVLVGRLSAL
jgi:hypothetical protein